jgi:hypothetical protein
MTESTHPKPTPPERPEVRESRVLSELPGDELVVYGRELGLQLEEGTPRGELLRQIRHRQALLEQLDRDALLDVVVWGRRPVRQSASKESLAREIATIKRMDLARLSDRGLRALAMLRGLDVLHDERRASVEARLRETEPFWDRVKRRRRKVMGSMISALLDTREDEVGEEYHFLPEDGGSESLKQRISDEGVVGGLARTLRGAADDYVKQKLDEIETRIDAKLDEIDVRLAEWRDREVANRLKIIKITLVASILVAILSYVYTYFSSQGS